MIVFNKQNNKGFTRTNFAKQNLRGFTIVELLVVISIMVILGVIFTNILIDALRGRNKVKAINQVKQNGQVVMDKLSNEIRNADGVVCVNKYSGAGANPDAVAKDTIVIVNGGTYTQFRFIASGSTTNGKIQKINFSKGNIPTDPITSKRVPDAQLCIDQSENTLNPDLKQHLTDTDSKNGVSVDYPPADSLGKRDIFAQNGANIIIKFNISAGVLAGYAYDVTVSEGGIPFSTSVQVRGIR